MPVEEIMNLVCLGLALTIATIGALHRFWAPKFFRWTQFAYDMVTISCLYYAIVLVSVIVSMNSLSLDGYPRQTDPGEIAILFSLFLVRISHMVERQWGEPFQVSVHGKDMEIHTKLTLPQEIIK